MKYLILSMLVIFAGCSYNGCPCNSEKAKHNRAELAKHSDY